MVELMDSIGKHIVGKFELKPMSASKKTEESNVKNDTKSKTEVFKTSAAEMASEVEEAKNSSNNLFFKPSRPPKHFTSLDDLKANAGDLQKDDTFGRDGITYTILYVDDSNGDDVVIHYSGNCTSGNMVL